MVSGISIITRVALSLSAIGLSACVVVPLPRAEPRKINDSEFTTIRIGETTSSQIWQEWGKPDLMWQAERIWVYDEGPSGRLFWLIAIPGGASGGDIAGGLNDLRDEVVIIQFSDRGTVERLDRRLKPANARLYGKFLEDWLNEPTATEG